MASQVYSGTSNFSYTNNTGQNVRIIINYMQSSVDGTGRQTLSMSWSGGPSITNSYIASGNPITIGRNLAFINNSPSQYGSNANNAASIYALTNGYPTELMLASGQSFSATCSNYNIVVIPEAG